MKLPTRSRSLRRPLSTALFALVGSISVGCASEALSPILTGDDDAEAIPAPTSGAARLDGQTISSTLTCVSSPRSSEHAFVPVVTRASIEPFADVGIRIETRVEPHFPWRTGDAFAPGLSVPLQPRRLTAMWDADADAFVGRFVTLDEEGDVAEDVDRADGEVSVVVVDADGTFPSVIVGDEAWSCFGDRALNAAFGGPPLLDDAAFVARYDDASGSCRDSKGDKAENQTPLWFVQETGLGSCANLRGARLNGDDFGMPALGGWDLRGADLSDAQLHFADLNWAALQGARLESFSFGYAVVAGVIDDATTLPVGDACVVSDNPWAGQQLHCER